MENFKKALLSVSKDLKSLGTKAEKLVKEVEKAFKTIKIVKPKAVKTKTAKKKIIKKASVKKIQAKKKVVKQTAVTAIEAVVGIIKRSKTGVDVATLVKKTGYDAKKISNLVYKAKKRGDIKSGSKGVYVKK